MRFMTSKKVKLTALVMAIFMVMALAAGCSSKSNTPKVADSTAAPSAAATAAPVATPEPAKKDPVKIVFWHYLTDRKDLLADMAKDFTSKTGIEVDIQLFGGDGFKEKTIAAAQTHSLPDIMTLSGGPGDLAKFVETKSVLELGKEESAILGQFPANILKTYTYAEGNTYKVKDLGTYALPMDTNNMMFMYNKDLFAKAGIAGPPATWKEFLDAVDKLNAQKIAPFATGLGSWVGTSMTEPYMYAYLGDEKLRATKAGKAPMVGSGWEKVIGIYSQMAQHKAFAAGVSTMDLPKAETLFANGQVAMIFDGSWAIGVFNQTNPNFKNYDAFLPPKPDDATNDIKIPGGVGVPLVVSAETKHKKETLQFMEFLLAKEQQQKYSASSFNLPANKDATAAGGNLPDALVHFAQGMTSVYENPASFLGDVETVMQKGIQLIVLGQSTPDKVVKQMEDATKKGAAAAK
jgi:ABC-type glycerol-3-phosphate transport system substrate-binding protein